MSILLSNVLSMYLLFEGLVGDWMVHLSYMGFSYHKMIYHPFCDTPFLKVELLNKALSKSMIQGEIFENAFVERFKYFLSNG